MKKLLAMAKNRAKTKGLPFDLTIEHMMELWDGSCAISGVELDLEPAGGRVARRAPSIDRIIPEYGYVQGNIRIVTYQVNVAMSEFGEQGLRKLVEEVAAG